MHPKVSVRDELETALPSAKTERRDLAAVALARRLSDDIDEADLVSVEFQILIADLIRECHVPAELVKRLQRMAARIEQTAVLTALAPKLSAALAALNMTPAARTAALTKGAEAGDRDPAAAPADDLDRIRRDRERRRAAW
jgi:hypothetical protein